MTARAEYRLLLRQDNADQRLTPIGYRLGLISEERYQKFRQKVESIEEGLNLLRSIQINSTGGKGKVEGVCSGDSSKPVTLEEILRRPELDYNSLKHFYPQLPDYPEDVIEQITIEVKYKGYIERQLMQVDQFRKMENKLIPADLDFNQLDNLRLEAREKLNKIRPRSIGQASRISGVSPADISVLMIYLEKMNRGKEYGEKTI